MAATSRHLSAALTLSSSFAREPSTSAAADKRAHPSSRCAPHGPSRQTLNRLLADPTLLVARRPQSLREHEICRALRASVGTARVHPRRQNDGSASHSDPRRAATILTLVVPAIYGAL